MSKYIIEIPDDVPFVLLRKKARGEFITKVVPVAELEELNSDYINEHFGELQDEAYQAGLNDAWEATKKIFGYEIDGAIPIADIGNVFGYEPCKAFCTADILRDFTVQEAIAKLKAYEDKQKDPIKVGDEVIAPCDKAVVAAIKDEFVYYLYADGDCGCTESKNLTKTGRHFGIANILEAMKQ